MVKQEILFRGLLRGIFISIITIVLLLIKEYQSFEIAVIFGLAVIIVGTLRLE